MQLSDEQQAVEEAIKAGQSVLATGPAGSGKSTLLNRLRSLHGDGLSVTASTGIAAMNVGGATLHSFTGIQRGEGTARELAARIGARGRRNIQSCKVLAIDEVSMISGQLFEKLDRIFRIVRGEIAAQNRGLPFGGVQLLCFGDFLQLPPVSTAAEPATFAFECRAWHESQIATHVFTKVFRQADQPFADALGCLRVGDIHNPAVEIIAKRNNAPVPTDGVRPVIIHTRNVDVDRLNMIELAKVDSPEVRLVAEDTGRVQDLERLDRDCLAPKVLCLRESCMVMLLANLDVEQGLVNGRMGVVLEVKQDEVLVRFGKRAVVAVKRRVFERQINGETLASRSQFPLRLSYAITSHKAQGLTLDRISCHLSKNDVFEPGMAYVAVSRVKTLNGLFLHRSSRLAFRAHPKAVAFYANACTPGVRIKHLLAA